MISQLHQLLVELFAGGAKKSLSAAQAKVLLARVRPRDAAGHARRRVAAELISDLERIYQRKKAAGKELAELLKATGTTLTDLNGIGPSGAARLLVEVRDVTRFPDRAHFASWNGTRADRRLLRRPGPPSPVPRRQPADQPGAAHHGRRPAPQPHRGSRLLRPQGGRRQDTQGSHAVPEAPALRHRLPPDGPRRPGTADGPGRTRGGGYWLQRGRLKPRRRRFGEVTSRTRHPRAYASRPAHSSGCSRRLRSTPDRSPRADRSDAGAGRPGRPAASRSTLVIAIPGGRTWHHPAPRYRPAHDPRAEKPADDASTDLTAAIERRQVVHGLISEYSRAA
jgi:Transposase IS116/IS110/IS902 family